MEKAGGKMNTPRQNWRVEAACPPCEWRGCWTGRLPEAAGQLMTIRKGDCTAHVWLETLPPWWLEEGQRQTWSALALIGWKAAHSHWDSGRGLSNGACQEAQGLLALSHSLASLLGHRELSSWDWGFPGDKDTRLQPPAHLRHSSLTESGTYSWTVTWKLPSCLGNPAISISWRMVPLGVGKGTSGTCELAEGGRAVCLWVF